MTIQAHIVAAPVKLSCGNCQATFDTKGEKRRHKASGCKTSGEEIDPRIMAEIRADVAAVKAQADAEWDALPDGRPWNIEDHISGRKL